MQSRYIPLAVAALLLLSGCLTPFQMTDSSTSSLDDTGGDPIVTYGDSVDGPTISVTGTGEATADADLAVVSVSVTDRTDTADAARARVAGDVDRMRAALRGANVSDEAVTTASFRVSPEYDFSGDRRELVGYVAEHAFKIEVDPDQAGDIVDLTVGNGADRVDGLQFTLSDETRAQLRAEALTTAVESARADADTIAAASDLSVTGVHSASTGGDFGPVPTTTAEDAAAGQSRTVLEPGPVTVSATVSVTYTAA
ncbi:MAG: SIMPL domain-containing protein [Halobacteriota archaeon]